MMPGRVEGAGKRTRPHAQRGRRAAPTACPPPAHPPLVLPRDCALPGPVSGRPCPRERPQPGAPDAASHLPAPPTRPPPPHRSAPSRGRCGVRGGVLLAAACSVRAMGSRCLASLARAQSTQLIRARVRECGWRLAAQARARCLNSTPSRPRSRPQRAVYCKLVLPACLPSHRRGAAGVCGAAGRAHPPPRSHRSSRAQAPNGGGLAPALGGKVVSEVVRVGGVCVWGGASGRRTN